MRALRAGGGVQIAIGHDTARAPPDARSGFLRARRLDELARLESLPCTRVVCRGGEVRSPSSAQPVRAASLEELRSAFDAFAFEAASAMAESVLAGRADDAGSLEALGLGALSLYNLLGFGRDPWVCDLLADTFRRLTALAPAGVERSHWRYRLAIAEWRGRGALDLALAAADGSVADASSFTGDPRAPIFKAWAYNGRAYVRSRRGDDVGAAQDAADGYAAIEGLCAAVPEVEIELARMFLANNCARVASG